MKTSRLGKLIVILLGAIGLLYIGGGAAHADTVNVQTQAVGNVAVNNNDSVSGSSSVQNNVSTSATPDVTNQHQTVVDASGKHDGIHNTTGAGDQAAAASSMSKSKLGPPATVPNSEIDASANSVNSASNQPLATVTTPPSDGGGTPVIVPVGTVVTATTSPGAPVAKVVYYQPRSVVPTMVATDHGTPMATNSAPDGQPKPTTPTLPQGTTALVSAPTTVSPLLRFHGSLAALQAARGLGQALVLILTVTLLSALVANTFLSFLRASGFSTAPRGSSPHPNFAFPVGEFGLSDRLKTNSLFSTPQRLPGSWWYQGGRTNALRKEVTT